MADPHQAVFLSYASQDAEAARRICDALRAAGVEVWFDQSELVGGDVWDAKIRGQIASCALFLPVISANTQARREGYFRLEWKLAAQRTHMISERTAFLLPVVIDGTRDADDDVPAEFRSVQWTRLALGPSNGLTGGAATPAFVARVSRLLADPAVETPTVALAGAPQPVASRTPSQRGVPRWAAALLAVLVLGLITFIALRPASKESPVPAPAKPASDSKPTLASDKPAVADKSIAVLPFVNLSDDKDANAFFADGIHEDILTNLALIRELRVVSRTSVMGYRGTTKKIGELAHELGVSYILEGSVRRLGNKVRVTGQLIRAATDEHLWAKSYDRELTDVFSIQAALADEIATALKTALSPEERSLLARKPTENAAAYDLYLKARGGRVSESRAREERAIALLQSAVELDPDFADAWALLAARHAQFVASGWDTTPARAAKSREAMARAVALAPESVQVGFNSAVIQMLAGDYARAAESLEKIRRLQPRFSEAYTTMGGVQRRSGEWSKAIVNYRTAVELDPANEFAVRAFADVLKGTRRWDEAEREQRRLAALVPASLDLAFATARIAHLARGSTQEMDDWFSRLPAAQKDSPRGIALRKEWAMAAGRFAEARRLDEQQPWFDEDGGEHSEQALKAAAVCLALGDTAAARARLGSLPAQLRARLETDPETPLVWRDLGQMEAILGNSAEALKCARRAMELRPEAKNALGGPALSLAFTVVLAWTGDKDSAIAELARLLRVPSPANVHELRSGPWFVSLRGDPRFEALLNDPKNNAPLF